MKKECVTMTLAFDLLIPKSIVPLFCVVSSSVHEVLRLKTKNVCYCVTTKCTKNMSHETFDQKSMGDFFFFWSPISV